MSAVPHPPLTIAEEFLLLALDDSAGQFYPLPRSTLDSSIAAAVLMDLTLLRRIDNDLRDMFVTDAQPTDNPILDPVLQIMSMAPVLTPRPIAAWLHDISNMGENLQEQALRHLEALGILRREDKKILWMFGTRRYPIIDQKEQREVKLRILGVILRDDIPTPHDIMLVALANACGLFRHILSDHELEAAAPRIEQVARMDLIGQAVAQAIAEIETVIAMASGFR
ncbi:MAG: GPP34 family phosphoprotein [Bdellovibrionales bacterium]